MGSFRLEQISLRRRGTSLLDRVTADIEAGRCTVLTGPSGAGKSTLLRVLVRLEEPTQGMAWYGESPLRSHDVCRLRRRVVLLAQTPLLLTDRIRDELAVGRPEAGADTPALLTRVGLPPEWADRPTAGLSGGEAARVCLARGLALGPEAVLLDEPTAALDPSSAAAVEDTVRDLVRWGRLVVVVTHDAALTRRLADHVIVLDHGRVAETGSPAAVTYLSAAE
ncbi:MAG: ABC transporter ATP-binding protein [Carbonactinosporaceae bacterium]